MSEFSLDFRLVVRKLNLHLLLVSLERAGNRGYPYLTCPAAGGQRGDAAADTVAPVV